MKKELELALVRDFPELCRDYGGDCRKTCMAWGFACGSGWEPILRRTLEKLQAHRQAIGASEGDMILSQVKEKWGGLRIYLTTSDDVAHEIVSEAERESYGVCEYCGAEGKRRNGGWISVLCDACAKEDE